MLEFYPQIKWLHIPAVMCSGMLFFLRGMLVLTGRGTWARHPAVRYLSYSIDSVLLTAALMLFTLLPSALFSNGWLMLKLVLLVLYIGLGVAALRAAQSRRAQAMYFVAALGVFWLIVSIARTHHPLGVLSLWL